MNDIQIRAALAGVFFGMWPLFMNRSGLSGNVASLTLAVTGLAIILPLAFYDGFQSLNNINVWPLLGACITSILGMLVFNSMLSKVANQQAGMSIVIMIMVQLTVPVIWTFVRYGDFSTKKVLGIITAFVAVALLG